MIHSLNYQVASHFSKAKESPRIVMNSRESKPAINENNSGGMVTSMSTNYPMMGRRIEYNQSDMILDFKRFPQNQQKKFPLVVETVDTRANKQLTSSQSLKTIPDNPAKIINSNNTPNQYQQLQQQQQQLQYLSQFHSLQQQQQQTVSSRNPKQTYEAPSRSRVDMLPLNQQSHQNYLSPSSASSAQSTVKNVHKRNILLSNVSSNSSAYKTIAVSPGVAQASSPGVLSPGKKSITPRKKSNPSKKREKTEESSAYQLKPVSKSGSQHSQSNNNNIYANQVPVKNLSQPSQKGSRQGSNSNIYGNHSLKQQHHRQQETNMLLVSSPHLSSAMKSPFHSNKTTSAKQNKTNNNPQTNTNKWKRQQSKRSKTPEGKGDQARSNRQEVNNNNNNNRERENYPEQQVSSQQQQQSSELVSSQQDPLRGSSQYSSPQASSRNHTNARNSQKENIPAGAIFPHSSGTAELNDHSKLPPNHSNNVSSNKSPSNSAPDERMLRLKALVEENVRKSLAEKQRKLEEAKIIEEHKKEKQEMIQAKNAEIRNLNAYRFSKTNKFSSHADLSRRLPWGINQEKLRNYAIQVLTKFKNQEKRQLMESLMQQKPISEMMSSFKAEEKQRRHQIGLDHLTDEEISRLVSASKLKMSMQNLSQQELLELHHQQQQQQHHYYSQQQQPNEAISSSDYPPEPMTERTKQKEEERKREELASYMEEKKHRMEQAELSKKLEKLLVEEKVKENQQILNNNIRSIFQRLKKRKHHHQSHQRHHTQTDRNNRSSPQQQYPLMTTGNSRHHTQPSYQQIPTAQNSTSKVPTQVYTQQRLTEPSQAEFIPQLRGVAVVKTEENNNNNNSNRLGISSSQSGMVRSNYISGTMPTLPSQSQGQQSQLYGGAVLATQPEYDGEMIQDENDYSALYEEFKQLIVSPNEKNQQVQIVQPALGYSQLAGGSSAAAMGRQNYLLTQESQYGQNNNISQQQQQLYLQQQQQLQQQAYAVYLQQQHSPLMERAVTSSSALRGSQYSVSGKKRNRTPINAGVAASKPSKHHGKIRRVKTSEGGKRTKKAKREEHIGQNLREGNNNNHQGGGMRRIMMIDEMGNTEDIEGGQQAVENASDREINNQLVAAKLKFDELARRLIQIKLNNSKNDSLNTNNLTKIPRQFLSNGQIEEKIESEDFDSSRKEFDNGSYVLHPSNNQIHNKNNNNNGNSEGESLLEAGQQLGILQDEHGHVAQKRIGMGNNNNSNTGDVQLLQQQQDKQNQLQQQQQKQYQMQQQQQQQHLQKDSSSSAILKVAEEEDVEKDDDDDDHSMNHHNNNLLESNLFENNEALYNQLEMQRNDPEEQERREEEQHSQPSNNSRRFAKRQGASQTPSKDEGHIDEHFDANGTHPDADDNHENYFVYENQQGKALQQAQQKQQLQQQQLQYQQQQLQQQQQQQGHYDGHGQEEDEEEDIGEFHSKDHGDDDDHHHDDVEHIHAGEGNHEQQWDYYDDMSEEQLQEMAQQIFVNSAVFIQKIWRGYFTRKILFYYLEILEKGEMDKFQAQGSEEEQHNQQGNKAIYEGHIYQDDNNHEEHEHQQGQEEEGEYMHNIHGDAGDNVNNHLQEYEGEEEENDGEYHFDGFQGSSLKDDDDAAAAGNGGGGLNSLNLKVQEDKFVHISTIKSSIVSNDDNIHSKIIIDGNNAQEKQLSAMIPNMQQGIKTNKMQSVNANAGAGGQEQDQRTAGQLLNQQLEHSEIFQQQQGLDGQQHEREEGIEGGEHEYDDDHHQEGEDDQEEGRFGQEFPQEQQQAGADIHRMEELNSEEENQQQEEQDQQHHQYPDHDGDEHYAHHHHHHDPNGAEPDDDEYDEHQQQQQQQYYSVAGMTEDSLINWKHVQQQVNYLAQSGHPEAKNQIIEVLQELSLSNRERLLQCIEDNDQDPEDSQNFSIEQIEAVFRIPFEQGMTGDEEEEEEDEGEKDPNQEGYAQGEDEQRHHEGSEGVTEEQQLEQDKKNHHHLQDHLNDQENSDKPTDVYERPEINYDNHGYSDLKGRVLLNEVRISSDRITVGSPDVQFGSPIPQQSQQNHQQGLAGQSSLQNQQMFSPLAGGTTTASNAATPSQALQILRTPIKDPTQDPPRKQRANGQLQIDLAIVEGEGHDDGKNVNDIDQMKNKGIHDDNVNQNAQGSEGKDIIKDSTQQVQISHPAEVPADGDDDQGHPTLGDATTSKQLASSSNPFSQKTPYNFLKSSDRQSNSSKGSSSKRAGGKTHSFTYEAQSERSFNQMRRNKFHSPKDLRLSHRNSGLTYQSDECQSLDPVSPKEELTQLYALLQQEQLLSNKKDKISRGSRNINTELQQEIVGKHAEYFELGNSRKEMNNSSTGKIKGGIAGVSAGQDEGLTNRSQPEKTMNASTSSIFDHDSFQAFNEKKIKQIMSTQNINEILSLREKALTMRHKSQMNAMDQMLSQKHVSPRTYDSKKQELENWVQNEKEEISQTRKELERGLMKAMESIQKTQRDVQLAQRFKTNPSRLDSRSSFASEEEYLFRRKMENEAASSKSDSDNQSDNLSSSQALKHLLKEMGTPTDKNNIKIIDQFELKDHHREDDAKNKDNNNNEVQDADGDNSRSKSKNQGNTNVLVLPKQQSQLAKMKMKKEPKKYADGDNEDEEEEEDEDIQHREQIGQGNNSNINNNRFKDDRAKSEDSLGTNQDFQSESQEKKRDSSFDDEIAASPTQEKKIIAVSADGNNSNNAVSNAAPAEGNKKLSSNKVKLVLDYNDLEHNSNSSQVDQSKKPQQEGQDSNLADPQVSSGVSNAIDNAAAQQNDKLGSDKSSQEAMTNSQKESISDQDDIDQLKFNEDSELAQERQHAFNQLSSPSAEFMERSEILAEMQDKWRTYNQIDARIQEQLQKLFSQDKSDNYGIATNLKIVTDYIQTLFNYVVDHYKQDFLDNLNTPFGFAPSKRLKLIHGYDSFVDSSCSEEGSTDDYNTLPFVLSEELFIEFEQNIIGNGETEKEQIIKEFEHIHNKAIFDTFNEALNIFRPFYTLGGPPYSWTKSEKNLVLGKASQKNLGFILEKSKARVMEWSSYLCGLVNEDEQPRQLPLEDEKGNPPPLSVLLENLTPQNEYLAQVREEKLSKMLLTEIFENEYKWQLYEDEKTEVVMELADLVFEQLVEEVVHDMSPRRNGRDAGEEEDQEGEIDGDFHGHEKEEGEEEQFGLDEFSQENLQQHDVHEDQEQHQE